MTKYTQEIPEPQMDIPYLGHLKAMMHRFCRRL